VDWSKESNVLEIVRSSNGEARVAYVLSGEITIDQIARLVALVDAARKRGKKVTLDLEHVWRVDRDAAALVARHASRSDDGVQVTGLSSGLREWLRSVVQEHQ
jgi:ABC-type transporter Mla MlaB component